MDTFNVPHEPETYILMAGLKPEASDPIATRPVCNEVSEPVVSQTDIESLGGHQVETRQLSHRPYERM